MSNVRLFSIDAIPNIDKTVWTIATSIMIRPPPCPPGARCSTSANTKSFEYSILCLGVATQLLVSYRGALRAVTKLFALSLSK